MMSHKSDNWATPQWFVKKLEKILAVEFNLDPCASYGNTKCQKYFTEQDNGLVQNWGGHNVFVNPPYSQAKEWAKKCFEEGQKENTLIVLLIPARVETKYFHDYCLKAQRLIFIKGRIKFELTEQSDLGCETQIKKRGTNSPPFPSIIVVFHPDDWALPFSPISTMDNKP